VDAGNDLFIRHSYLSVLARFLVATALWPDEAKNGDFAYINGIVTGNYFKSKRIQNLADEDFFHWVGEETVLASLEGTWLRVLNQLKTYDYALLDEDILKGVYQELVYRTALSKHVIPFYVDEELPYIILPLMPGKDEEGRPEPILADAAALKKAGYRGGAVWFAKAEEAWEKNRGAKSSRMDLAERLDYQRLLRAQSNSSRWIVLYNASGTNLSAASVDMHIINRFIVDHKTYWYATDTKNEACYLLGILNSETVNEVIKPFQSAGSQGERDIHKVPLEIPFSRFDPKNVLHVEIAQRSEETAALVAGAARARALEGSLAKRRATAREVAALPLARLDELVKKLLES